MAALIQIILVFITFAAMVAIIIGIGRLYDGESLESPEKTSDLRREVEESIDVVSENSVFESLLVRRDSQNDISRGPSSRKL